MKKNLSLKETILVASTLFGMFFGAGNLIFPVHMGQLAGSNVWPAIIGFIITGVSIPILAVAAIGNTHSDGLQTLSNKVGKTFSYIFTAALYLTIGPFFAIPRCATVSFTTGIADLLKDEKSQSAALLIFTAIFFILVLLFSLKPAGIMTWIGKIINPVFLVFLAILVVAALVNPSTNISSVAPTGNYIDKSFFQGFIEGYGTMDAIAGLAFGVIVVNVIKGLGVNNANDIAKGALKSGVFAGILMAIIYILTTIMGTQSLGALEVSDNGGIALRQISGYYLGNAGKVVLALAISLACLKTAIGLVTSCATTFEQMFEKRVSYKAWVIIFTLFSFAISNVGLTAIINYSIPVLMLLYPLTIVLIILALTEGLFNKARCVYVCTMIGAFIAAIFDFIKTLPFGINVSFASKILPFFDLGLGWIVPSIIGFIIGLIISKTKRA